jgi:antitoxin CptB
MRIIRFQREETNIVDSQTEERRRHEELVYWRSRRGMLELELHLLPFVEKRYQALGAADRAAYADLLERGDWEIFDWLSGRESPEDPALRRIVELILTPEDP